MKLEFTPFGTLSMEEADQLINKEWFHDLLENFPNKDRHFHLFPICRAALKANVSIEEAEPLILKALEKVGGSTRFAEYHKMIPISDGTRTASRDVQTVPISKNQGHGSIVQSIVQQ